MKVCLTLSILGAPALLRALLDDMRRRRPRGWRETTATSPDVSLWAQSDEPRSGDPLVFFGSEDPMELSVLNVVPSQTAPAEFTLAAYNQTVRHFAQSIRPLALQHGLDIRLGDPHEDFTDVVSEAALTSLQSFVQSTLASDPIADLSWARFVSLVFLQATRVRPPELRAWFKRQGCGEAEAKRWTSEYVRGYTILEQTTALQARVHAIRQELLAHPGTSVIQ